MGRGKKSCAIGIGQSVRVPSLMKCGLLSHSLPQSVCLSLSLSLSFLTLFDKPSPIWRGHYEGLGGRSWLK